MRVLCLRCWVSHLIPSACRQSRKVQGLCSRYFTYPQVLQLLLNDDGRTLFIQEGQDKPHRLMADGTLVPIENALDEFLTIRVLSTYRWDIEPRQSLKNWLYRILPQYLKSILNGFLFTDVTRYQSDWALLNQQLPQRRLDQLSDQERQLLNVFHQSYRQDKLRRKRAGGTPNPAPSNAQLTEMMVHLKPQGLVFSTPTELLQTLQQLASQLRALDMKNTVALENQDPETGQWREWPELLSPGLDSEALEEQDLLEFLAQQPLIALGEAVPQGIPIHMEKLTQMRQGHLFAPKFIPFLQFFYRQCLSQGEIAKELGFTGGTQVSRRMRPKELLDWVRARTIGDITDRTLQKAHEKGLTALPPQPTYLKAVHEQIVGLADAKIFLEAHKEAFDSKTRARNSLYAQQIRLYLDQHDCDQGDPQ